MAIGIAVFQGEHLRNVVVMGGPTMRRLLHASSVVPMRRSSFVSVIGVGAVVAAMLSASPASAGSAATIGCGDTITTNVVLTRNLDCTGDGLIVGAGVAGITIDLNGYALSGSGSGYGIRGGFSGVTIQNGKIRNFNIAVLSMRGRLDGLKILDNSIGAFDFTGEINGSTFRDNGDAVRTGATFVGISVIGSTFVANQAGIVSSIAPIRVDSSTFRENTTAISGFDNDIFVTDSRFVGNTTSITTFICGVRIFDSVFSGGEVAVQVGTQGGYPLDVERNRFSGSKIGLRLTGLLFPPRDDRPYTIADNVFADNGASGLVLDMINQGGSLLVSANVFKRNGFSPDAFTASTGAVLDAGLWANTGTFANNHAVSNAGYGIEAYGVIDGGGNTAKRNGNPDQCLGVTCTE